MLTDKEKTLIRNGVKSALKEIPTLTADMMYLSFKAMFRGHTDEELVEVRDIILDERRKNVN